MSNGLTVIESSGTTTLLTDGTYYYLQIGDGPTVELSYNGRRLLSVNWRLDSDSGAADRDRL